MSRQDESAASFGTRLKALREGAGLTQPQLARLVHDATGGTIDLAPSAISRYERGKVKSPGLEIVQALAKALDAPVAELTRLQDQPDRLEALEGLVGQIWQLNVAGFRAIEATLAEIARSLGLEGPATAPPQSRDAQVG